MTARIPAPMLARLETSLPVGERWRYEPKFDGFRGLLWHTATGSIHLLSRNQRDLTPAFPELADAARALPAGTLLDGEIVIADQRGHSDFGALQSRLSTRRRGPPPRQSCAGDAAVLLVFDLVAARGRMLLDNRLTERRARLEELLAHNCNPRLQLVDQTAEVPLAREWLRLAAPLEGVVAKRADGRYVPGARDWVKVKRYRTADCAVIGLCGDADRPSLVLGLVHPDGQVHHFGVSRPVPADARGRIASLLDAAGANEPAIRSRWQHDAVPPWRRIQDPFLVCEVSYTLLDGGRWLRHAARFVRWRPDRAPSDCTLSQLR